MYACSICDLFAHACFIIICFLVLVSRMSQASGGKQGECDKGGGKQGGREKRPCKNVFANGFFGDYPCMSTNCKYEHRSGLVAKWLPKTCYQWVRQKLDPVFAPGYEPPRCSSGASEPCGLSQPGQYLDHMFSPNIDRRMRTEPIFPAESEFHIQMPPGRRGAECRVLNDRYRNAFQEFRNSQKELFNVENQRRK